MNKVKGRIIFSQRTLGQDIPAQNMRVELWDLDVIKNDFLAVGYTNVDGTFLLEYNFDAEDRWSDKPDLILRLLDREYYYDSHGEPKSKWSVVASFDGDENVTVEEYDFKTREVSYWEYENPEDPKKVGFTPRVAVVEGRIPQPARTGHAIAQAAVAVNNSPEMLRFKLINKFNSDRPKIGELNRYPQNLTRKMGTTKSSSDDYLTEIVLNGFNPCILRKHDDKYTVDFRWDGINLDNRHFSPNTMATFRVQNDSLTLESISVQKRIGGNFDAHAGYRPAKIYTPQSAEWIQVKRLFRVNYFAFGEVNTHLTGTHLNIEQYNIAIRRHLHKNPLARLLLPHFYGTVAVNLGANDLLMSEDGLVGKGSPLTPESVQHVSRSFLGTLNWSGWEPRSAICSGHRFAKLGVLYWEVLTSYLDDYFRENLDEIKTHWAEILSMSNELIGRSVPYVDDGSDFYDMGEINDSSKPHPIVNGIEVALSPVTESGMANEEGLSNLKQLCRYILFHATFKHSWVNDTQYDIGGEVMFASLGVSDDLTSLEVNPEEVVPPDEGLLQPFITYLLTYTKYGYIVRNEDDDMNPALIELLRSKAGEFEALGLNIRDIRSCINT